MKVFESQVIDEKFNGIIVSPPWDDDFPLFMSTKYLANGKSLRIRAGLKPVLVFLVGKLQVHAGEQVDIADTGKIIEIEPSEDVKFTALEDSWFHVMRAWKKPKKSPYLDY